MVLQMEGVNATKRMSCHAIQSESLLSKLRFLQPLLAIFVILHSISFGRLRRSKSDLICEESLALSASASLLFLQSVAVALKV